MSRSNSWQSPARPAGRVQLGRLQLQGSQSGRASESQMDAGSSPRAAPKFALATHHRLISKGRRFHRAVEIFLACSRAIPRRGTPAPPADPEGSHVTGPRASPAANPRAIVPRRLGPLPPTNPGSASASQRPMALRGESRAGPTSPASPRPAALTRAGGPPQRPSWKPASATDAALASLLPSARANSGRIGQQDSGPPNPAPRRDPS
jgi:hypothetical protein